MFIRATSFVAIVALALPAIADHNHPPRGGDLAAAAAQVREDAETLVRTLGREGNPNAFMLIHAAGMLAKEADDLARVAQDPWSRSQRGIDAEYQDVEQQWHQLRGAWEFSRVRTSPQAERDFAILARSVYELEYAYGGGGDDGRDDGFDDGFEDSGDGRDDGHDGGDDHDGPGDDDDGGFGR